MRLFVYGTLLAGERNHARLSGAAPVGAARTAPGWCLCDCGPYPAMVEGEGAVTGEVYEVSPAMLEDLDLFEGVPSGLYLRVTVALADGSRAFAYVMPPADAAHLPRIPTAEQNRSVLTLGLVGSHGLVYRPAL